MVVSTLSRIALSRRRALAALSGVLLTALSAGALQAQTPARAKPFRVVTTFTVLQDIAQNVAGDRAIVESITKPGAEIHDYQPTPLDIVRAQAADLGRAPIPVSPIPMPGCHPRTH
jgi:manganese/iron transport system substrate-binding protein